MNAPDAPLADYARPKHFTHRLSDEELTALRKYAAGLLPDREGRMALKAFVSRVYSDLQARGFYVCAAVERSH